LEQKLDYKNQLTIKKRSINRKTSKALDFQSSFFGKNNDSKTVIFSAVFSVSNRKILTVLKNFLFETSNIQRFLIWNQNCFYLFEVRDEK